MSTAPPQSPRAIAAPPFDAERILETELTKLGDGSAGGGVVDDDEKALTLRLTKEFGESSSAEVGQLLRAQQDMMCADIVCEVEKKLTELMSQPSTGAGAISNPAVVAPMVAAMTSNVRKSVDKIRGVNASVSQRAVASLVDELAAEHVGTLLRFTTRRSEAVRVCDACPTLLNPA
jgi:hypothetical protein